MHILIAPNAFKNSLNAEQVADAIARGLMQSKLDCTTTCLPVADGGDGTASLLINTGKGEIVHHDVHNPLGRKIQSSFGLIDGGRTAVIEMADASGLRLLKSDELNPMRASSYGTGELIRAALDKGVDKIIIAMGGSATVDGGCGILSALGMRFLNEHFESLKPIPAELISMTRVDTSDIDKRIFECDVVILCDVGNTLLGPQGAAYVFGPQKGATAADVNQLEVFLSRLSKVAQRQTGIDIASVKHGGAAGGATAGLHAFINARLVNGIDYFLSFAGFDEAIKSAGLVITGEGAIDRQTLQGKGPFGVAQRAKRRNIPVIGIAGSVPVQHDDELQCYFDALIAIGNQPTDLINAMAHTEQNLQRTAKLIGDMLSLKPAFPQKP